MARILALTALLFAFPAQAVVDIEWVIVGHPGNAADDTGFGAVASMYQIGRYEVTNLQYTQFLNAVAATDTYGLYSTGMGSGTGGITRSGSPGSYSYSAILARRNMPVNYVSFWDALRFANWLHNRQPTGAQDSTTTEDGAYTLTPDGIANNTVARNPGARVFVTSEDEWYKGAYFDPGTSSYFDYPAGSDAQTGCAVPGATANTANCNFAVHDLTTAGSYTSSPSPIGTFDQGGNIMEWNETILPGQLESDRGLRGGFFDGHPSTLGASFRSLADPLIGGETVGFRVASPVPPVPSLSPFGLLLVAAGLLGVGGWLRGRA